jgi:hypothetical protein
MQPNEQKDYWQPEGNEEEAVAAGGTEEQTDSPAEAQPNVAQESPEVQWEASEYIHHEKGVMWFVVLGIITLILGAVAFYFQAWTFLGLIVVMFAALAVYARRPPRTLHYTVSLHGFTIDEKAYQYNEFKAFGVQQDGAFYSIVLIPTKRFMPAVNMFFDEKDGEKIVDILGTHLPMQKMEPDLLDVVFRKLRF